MSKTFFFVVIVSMLWSCKKKEHLVNVESKRIEMDSTINDNSAIQDFISPYSVHINKTLDSTLAYSPKTYSKSDGNLNTAIGNLMADIIIEQATPVFESRTNNTITMVLLNHGGIRASIPEGAVTARTAYEVMPFENSIVVVEMKGTHIKKLLEYLCKAKKAHPISGLKVIVDRNYNLVEASIGEKEINEEKTYFVATNDYLYNGGDRMYFFREAGKAHHLGYKIRNAMIDYFKKVDTIAPTIDDRFLQIQ